MRADSYVVERTSTLDLSPRDRADFWSEHVRANHCRLDYRYPVPGDFRGATAVQRGPRYQLVDFWEDGISYVRSSQQYRNDQDDDVRLLVPVAGSFTVLTDEGAQRLVRGDGGLLSTSSPFEVVHEERSRALLMTLPRAELRVSAPCIDLRHGSGAVLAALLRRLAAERDHLAADEFETVCEQAVDLLGRLTAPASGPGRLELVAREFHEHVVAHADDPRLSGATVAHAIGWSLRQVQVALQARGTTPHAVIREVRLRRARRRLLDPGLAHLGAAEIGFRSGFASVSAFGAAFRERYGTSPGALRASRSAC